MHCDGIFSKVRTREGKQIAGRSKYVRLPYIIASYHRTRHRTDVLRSASRAVDSGKTDFSLYPAKAGFVHLSRFRPATILSDNIIDPARSLRAWCGYRYILYLGIILFFVFFLFYLYNRVEYSRAVHQ